jgi:hypothetical protein
MIHYYTAIILIQSNISDTQLPSQSEPNLNLLTDGESHDRSQSHPDLKSGDLEKPPDQSIKTKMYHII